MNTGESNRLPFLIVTVSFLSIIVMIVQLFGLAGLIGVALAITLSTIVILILQKL